MHGYQVVNLVDVCAVWRFVSSSRLPFVGCLEQSSFDLNGTTVNYTLTVIINDRNTFYAICIH
jgi:hypothetical protein